MKYISTGFGASAVSALRKGNVDGLMYWASAIAGFQNSDLKLRLLQADDWQTYPDYSLSVMQKTTKSDPKLVQARLFHYPPQETIPSEDAGFGVAPHTDYGMMTLLSQDPIGGLELRTLGGEWVSAPYIEGTLIINLGDLLRRWTNDIYVSNPHKLVNRSGKERYSIPMFFNLDFDAHVACLPTCQSPDNPPKHEPILSGDYLISRFRDVQKLGQKI